MSLTIDYVTMPPKSQEVSQIQHGEQLRNEQSQQQVASQFQQQVHQNTHQTIRRTRPENEEYTYDDTERGGKQRRKKKGGKQKREEDGKDGENAFRSEGGRFDMKI